MLHPSLSKTPFPLITSPYENDITNRWLPEISNEQHHSMKAISASQIKYWHKNLPWNWYQKYIVRSVPNKSNPNFLMGTLIHLAILEQEKFENSVIVCNLDQRTTAFKDWIDEKFGTPIPSLEPVDSEKKSKKKETKYIVHKGKDGQYLKDGKEFFVIKQEEMDTLRAIQKSVFSHKLASALLENSVPEISGVAQCPVTGLFLNIRGDARGHDYFIDLKSCQDASETEVIKSICNFGYGFQHAQYLEVGNLIEGHSRFKKFFFLFVSKEPPYECGMFHLDLHSIAWFKARRLEILKEIKDCQDSGKWARTDGEGYGKVISLPQWALK